MRHAARRSSTAGNQLPGRGFVRPRAPLGRRQAMGSLRQELLRGPSGRRREEVSGLSLALLEAGSCRLLQARALR